MWNQINKARRAGHFPYMFFITDKSGNAKKIRINTQRRLMFYQHGLSDFFGIHIWCIEIHRQYFKVLKCTYNKHSYLCLLTPVTSTKHWFAQLLDPTHLNSKTLLCDLPKNVAPVSLLIVRASYEVLWWKEDWLYSPKLLVFLWGTHQNTYKF